MNRKKRIKILQSILDYDRETLRLYTEFHRSKKELRRLLPKENDPDDPYQLYPKTDMEALLKVREALDETQKEYLNRLNSIHSCPPVSEEEKIREIEREIRTLQARINAEAKNPCRACLKRNSR